MNLIDFQYMKRCGRCGHLIPIVLSKCPYCNDVYKPLKVGDITPGNEEPKDSESAINFSLSAHQRKILYSCLAILAVIVIGLIGYNWYAKSTILNKSIFEPLSSGDIQSLNKKNADFAHFYQQAENIRNGLKTQEDKEKYGDISYAQLYEYLAYYGNEVYCNDIIDKANKEYEEKVHQPVLAKETELVNKWRTFLKDNNVNLYLKVDVVEDVEFIYGLPGFYFKLSMPKGNLSDAEVLVRIMDKRSHTLTYGTEEVRWNLNVLQQLTSSNALYLKGRGRDFWEQNEVKTEIKSVTLSNGKKIMADMTSQVPAEVMAYLNDSTSVNEYLMICKQIDANYPSKEKYANDKLMSSLEQVDKVCFELVEKINLSLNCVHRGFPVYEEQYPSSSPEVSTQSVNHEDNSEYDPNEY